MAERDEGSGLRAEDAYEKQYMTPGDEEVIYRDKFVASWHWHAIMGFATLVTLGSMMLPWLTGETPAPWWLVLLSTLPMVALWLLFMVIRVTVTTKSVQVQMGPVGPKIALEDIEAVEAVDYNWMSYGGWGVRWAPGKGVAYNMMGDAGKAVKIKRKTRAGSRDVLVSSKAAPLIVDAVRQALERTGQADGVVFGQEEVTLDFGEDQESQESVEVAEEVSAK